MLQVDLDELEQGILTLEESKKRIDDYIYTIDTAIRGIISCNIDSRQDELRMLKLQMDDLLLLSIVLKQLLYAAQLSQYQICTAYKKSMLQCENSFIMPRADKSLKTILLHNLKKQLNEINDNKGIIAHG